MSFWTEILAFCESTTERIGERLLRDFGVVLAQRARASSCAALQGARDGSSHLHNLVGVASGAMLGAIEKTPKIWDVAGVWAIVQAAGGIWIDLGREPRFPLEPERDYGARSYPTLALASNDLRSLPEPSVRSMLVGDTSPST